MAVDIQKLFNEELPAKIAQNADAAKQIGGKFQINITGDGGGQWFVEATDAAQKVAPGSPGNEDVAITMASEDFQKLYENPQANGMQLFFAGRLKITGNNMLAMKLQKLFTIGS